jgi:predicted RecA/RadA family phage recombinase
MKTVLQTLGDRVQITAGGTLTAGTGVLTGQLFGVPETDAVSGGLVTIRIAGVVTLAKTSALAIDIGDTVYWDDTNKVVNKTSSAQKEVGIAISAAANPSATVEVLLLPVARTSVAA